VREVSGQWDAFTFGEKVQIVASRCFMWTVETPLTAGCPGWCPHQPDLRTYRANGTTAACCPYCKCTPWGAHPFWGFYSVLFRIGVSYFFAAVIMMNTSIRGQIYWTFGLLIGYWLLMRFVPVPGHGIGDFSKDGNVASYFRDLFADNISYNFRYVLNIDLITSISNALLGVLAGQWLLSERTAAEKAKWLFFGGVILIVVSLFSHLDFPINKHLASPSFTLLTCGISAVLLSSFYWIIDVKGHQKWAFFFVVVGVNPITIYVASSLLNFKKVANVFVGGIDFGSAEALALAITIAAVKWLFLYYLYRQKIFFKI
jgi:predicted acyltransferase